MVGQVPRSAKCPRRPTSLVGEMLFVAQSHKGMTVSVQAAAVELLERDPDRDAALTGHTERVGVLPDVLLGQPVDLIVRAVVDERCRPTDGEPAVRVLRIDNGQCNAAVAGDIRRLCPAVSSVEGDTGLVDVYPHDRRVRRPVRSKVTYDADERLRQELPLGIRELDHEIATMRSIAARARSRMSSGTVTTYFQSLIQSRSFSSVIIFMLRQIAFSHTPSN